MKKIIIAKDKKHLKELIGKEIKINGFNCDLNHINISYLKDISAIFQNLEFDGDISEWDVSNVENMNSLFAHSKFNGDISKWDVSNVKDMTSIFYMSFFNGEIGGWDVSNVSEISFIFSSCKFDKNVDDWNIKSVVDLNSSCFRGSKINPWWNIEDKNERQSEIIKRKIESSFKKVDNNKKIKL